MKTYDITGMSCAACSSRVQKAVSSLDGVELCEVNLLTNSMRVEGSVTNEDVVNAVEKAGYGADLRKDTSMEQSSQMETDHTSKKLEDKESPLILKRLIWSLVILIPLMYLTMGHGMWGFPAPAILEKSKLVFALVQLTLTTLIMIINKKFFTSGFKGLIHLAPNMDTLVALGAGVSYGYSLFILFKMAYNTEIAGSSGHLIHMLYFESAATILTLITLGKYLEARSKGKTTNAIKSLIDLAPNTGVVLRDKEEVEIPVKDIKKGDIFILKPGARVPVDGVVIEGYSSIDESALTGESMPIDKKIGDKVSGATINTNGFLKCQAVNVGEDTALWQIIKLVEEASASKAPISKIADKVSGVFVPVVMGLSLITFIVWMLLGYQFAFSLERAISILVISCPCALGLATPVAIMVGSGKGAKNGIMFKSAPALEEAGRTEILALDKTGTITTGKPEVKEIKTLNGFDEEKLISIAASIEKMSQHPLAQAVVRLADEKNIDKSLDIQSFKNHEGSGISGKLNEKTVFAGKLEFVKTMAQVDSSYEVIGQNLAKKAMTSIYIGYENKLIGIMGIADKVKEDSKKAIAQAKAMGIKTVMITGDNKTTASVIGKQVGVDMVYSQVLPKDKDSIVKSLMESGKTMMVGDGINDGPALTRANVGVAIGSGTDVAIDAADVVLMKNSLMDVVAAIRLSKGTLRNIHENLFWAFIYNLIGIPLAAGVLMPAFNIGLNPMFGAAAMSLSSFCVVTNALRINWFNLYKNINTSINESEHEIVDSEKGDLEMEKVLKIEGMMCGHCEATVKKALESLEQVSEAQVSHEDGKAVVKLSQQVDDSVLVKAVEDKEYKVLSVN